MQRSNLTGKRAHMGPGLAYISPAGIHPHAHPPVHRGLRAPKQISPKNGAIFNNYPRTTTVTWNPVPHAASYTVEIDCFHCCQANKWCTDVGQTWQVAKGITTTSFTFNFVGAQPGRWRVWAVGRLGRDGHKSPWREFTYTV